uniref:Uncharacterized protein n=1 Tax=Oryza punctata TaxID=4537 RepID=A0A0E0M7K8_ORYPU
MASISGSIAGSGSYRDRNTRPGAASAPACIFAALSLLSLAGQKAPFSRHGELARACITVLMFKKDEVGFAPEQLPPPGVKRPMCWCGDEFCFQISDDWDSYGQRYWMCRNYSYSPEKPKPVPKGRKGKVKIPVKEPEVPPPICDFVEWIDKEMFEFDKRLIKSWRERQEEREERQR